MIIIKLVIANLCVFLAALIMAEMLKCVIDAWWVYPFTFFGAGQIYVGVSSLIQWRTSTDEAVKGREI